VLPVKAQLVQTDNTLGTQMSTRGKTFVINGGTTASTNLFHSFSSFSVPQGTIVEFQSDPAIANILARVTGGQKSEIDGLIQSAGKANLFLINPKGILFGTSARLELRGSFVGTTANAIQFPNGGEFSLTSSVSPQNSLLRVNPSALLFTQLQPAPIENRSTALGTTRIPDTSAPIDVRGLSVPVGKSLLLAGGKVLLDGGRLNALRGRVDLAGIAAPGSIELTQDANQRLALRPLPETVTRGDVILLNKAQVNLETALGKRGRISIVLGSIGGDVAIQARNVSLQDSQITSGTIGQDNGGTISINADTISLRQNSSITSQTNKTGNAGDIVLKAANVITIDNSDLRSPTIANGKGGDIQITASEFRAINGKIDAGTQGAGNAGNISITAANGVNFNGTKLSTGGQLSTDAIIGSSGGVEIQAGALSLDNGAEIFSPNAGEKAAGMIQLQIQGDVSLTGGSRISSEALGNGRGGDITLKAQSLEVTDSFVRSATFGQGNAGSIQATVRDRVSVQVDQANQMNDLTKLPIGLSASTNGQGQGGTLTIKADQIELRGKPGSRSGLFAAATSIGSAGDIALSTRQLTVQDGAQVSVESRNLQKGQAGDMRINTGSITLDNQGEITAKTASGNGGNIDLNVQDVLLMRHNSRISTSAGTAQAGGNGGNITITAPNGFLVTALNANNDITANAFTGSGGNVNITAQQIYGFVPLSRDELLKLRPLDLDPTQLPTNDITAISQGNPNLNGTVRITTPDVDPSRGLVALPANLVDASNQIAQGCAPRNGQTSSFVATGRGGLPLNPRGQLQGRSTMIDWVSVTSESEHDRQNGVSEKLAPPSVSLPQPKIVEAQGWIKDANGQVILVTQSPVTIPNPCLAR
jgi:filamentous hemagglutinin family protein